ncbi:fluoride efflux transporter CrcB [Actinomycetes bacterium M1A6_2h]
MTVVLLTFAAGALGAVIRFVLDSEIKTRVGHPFPVGTFVINVAGSLILGVVAGLVMFSGQPSAWQSVVGTGFCGGFTTFSTASVETVRLIQNGRHRVAAANLVSNALVCIGACGLGLWLAWVL